MAGRAGYSGFVARQPGYMLFTEYKWISYSNFNTAVLYEQPGLSITW